MIDELVQMRSDRSWLIDNNDQLTVDLEECLTLKGAAEENPPDCGGFPWGKVVVAGLAGVIGGMLID